MKSQRRCWLKILLFILKDSVGNVVWESGSNRSATSSANDAGVVDLPTHTFM